MVLAWVGCNSSFVLKHILIFPASKGQTWTRRYALVERQGARVPGEQLFLQNGERLCVADTLCTPNELGTNIIGIYFSSLVALKDTEEREIKKSLLRPFNEAEANRRLLTR